MFSSCNLKDIHSLAIFNAIRKGNNTIDQICKATGICYLTVREITMQMVDKHLLVVSKPKREGRGRRKLNYSFDKKFFTVYFIETNEDFSCIAINLEDKVVSRFEHFKRRDGTTLKESVKAFVGKIRKIYEYKKYCVGVFGTCSENVAALMPSEFRMISPEQLVIESFSYDDKISVFKLNNLITVSLYGHIYNPSKDVTVDDLRRTLPSVDKYIECEGELFLEVFDAMGAFTEKRLVELL